MLITLHSDFGAQDYFTGLARTVLKQALPAADIVDLNHDIVPFHILQCAYILKSGFNLFPPGTVHLSLFEMLASAPAGLVMARCGEQFILSADNGLIPLAFEDETPEYSYQDLGAGTYLTWIEQTARKLAEWETRGRHFEPDRGFSPKLPPLGLAPYRSGDLLECQIIHIDRFGNLVLNLTRQLFEKVGRGRSFVISFSRNHTFTRLSTHYHDVPEGEKVCFFNSGGFLEIAINKGSAAQLFGLELVGNRQLVYQKIKIDFQ